VCRQLLAVDLVEPMLETFAKHRQDAHVEISAGVDSGAGARRVDLGELDWDLVPRLLTFCWSAWPRFGGFWQS
jgi:hypothetical protein